MKHELKKKKIMGKREAVYMHMILLESPNQKWCHGISFLNKI